MTYGTGLTRWVSRIPTQRKPANIAMVTIGRNIGSEPMSEDKWQAFIADAHVTLSATIGAPSFTVTGRGGEWNGEPEDSTVFTVLNPDGNYAGRLRLALRDLAVAYGQECIALTMGDGELIDA